MVVASGGNLARAQHCRPCTHRAEWDVSGVRGHIDVVRVARSEAVAIRWHGQPSIGEALRSICATPAHRAEDKSINCFRGLGAGRSQTVKKHLAPSWVWSWSQAFEVKSGACDACPGVD